LVLSRHASRYEVGRRSEEVTAIVDAAKPDTVSRWEYRVLIFDAENSPKGQFKNLNTADLDALGAEGWELVSTDALAGEPGFGLPRTTRISLWFKRRLEA
jgi:hypothetical protein